MLGFNASLYCQMIASKYEYKMVTLFCSIPIVNVSLLRRLLHLYFLQRPVIDDPCTTLPASLYTINTSVTFMNGSQANYVSNNIMDTSGDSMGRFNVSYNDNFDEKSKLVSNAIYVFTVNSDNAQPPPTLPPPTPSKYLLCLCSYVCIFNEYDMHCIDI